MQGKVPSDIPQVPISRRDYQEILLARMAGGDLYANELRLKIREVDRKLDALRIAAGCRPLYPPKNERTHIQARDDTH